MYDVIIVGAGPIGLYSAFYAGLKQFKALLIEQEQQVGGQLNLYLEKQILDVPSRMAITASELKAALWAQYQTYQEQVPLMLGVTITASRQNEDKTYTLSLSNGLEVVTKTLLLTTGLGRMLPRKLDVPGAGNNPALFYTMRKTAEMAGKRVAILGGGDSALDWALALTPVAATTTLIHRRTTFRAHQDSVNKLMASSAALVTPYLVKAIESTAAGEVIVLEHVDDQSEKRITVDLIMVNYGMIASGLGALNTLGLNVASSGAVIIDPTGATSAPGVFAAGNAADYPGKVRSLAAGWGDVVSAINSINQYLNPGKNVPFTYSSMKKG